MITIRTLICLVSALGISSTLASEPSFKFSRGIVAPQLTQEELLAVTLDTNVFAATEAGLPDMRLLDDQGGAVAYLLRKAQVTRTVTVRKTWSSRQPDARLLDGGGLEITVELQ
jgi:hypothetical protein